MTTRLQCDLSNSYETFLLEAMYRRCLEEGFAFTGDQETYVLESERKPSLANQGTSIEVWRHRLYRCYTTGSKWYFPIEREVKDYRLTLIKRHSLKGAWCARKASERGYYVEIKRPALTLWSSKVGEENVLTFAYPERYPQTWSFEESIGRLPADTPLGFIQDTLALKERNHPKYVWPLTSSQLARFTHDLKAIQASAVSARSSHPLQA